MVRGVKHLRVDVGLLVSWIAQGCRADVTSEERYILYIVNGFCVTFRRLVVDELLHFNLLSIEFVPYAAFNLNFVSNESCIIYNYMNAAF